MKTADAIRARRAVKQFDANHRMTEKEITELLSLAVLSPTAFNIQNWRFVVVSDPELRKQIRAVAWDQAQVTDTSLFNASYMFVYVRYRIDTTLRRRYY